MITPESGGIKLDVDQRMVLRSLSRFKFVYCVFPRGFGKCVTGDTLLFTDEGVKEIGEYFGYQDDGNETYTKHDINMVNRYGELEKSDKGVYSGYKNTQRVITEEGYEIEGTDEHPLLTMNTDGELEWKKLIDMQEGDFIAINRDNDVWGNKTKLDVSKESMNEWLSTFNNDARWKVERSKCNVITELDEEFALILGYLVGDGCMIRDNVVMFSNIDKEILGNYRDFVENRLGAKVKRKGVDSCDYITHGMYIREYLRQVGLEQVNSHGKKIPDCIMHAPKSMVKQFLIGLYDTDGFVDKSRVSHTTASKQMSKQLQTLLLNFGIVSTRMKKYNKEFKTYSYCTDIYGENINKFQDSIGFGCSRKIETLKESILTKRNTNKDVVPFQRKSVNDCFDRIRDSGNHDALMYDRFYHVRKGNNELTYTRLNELVETGNEEVCSLNELYNLHYFYSKVKTISESKAHVYDLQMPNTKSFIANGIVSHNTFLELMYNYHTCIFFPDIDVSMTAQTKENAASLVESKWTEVSRFYPLINNELKGKPNISRDRALVEFKSNGNIDTLANSASSLGQRRKRISVEEYAQVDDDVFQMCLEPVVNIPRNTIGKHSVVSPYELNGQIIYLTTSWYVG